LGLKTKIIKFRSPGDLPMDPRWIFMPNTTLKYYELFSLSLYCIGVMGLGVSVGRQKEMMTSEAHVRHLLFCKLKKMCGLI